MRRTVEKFKNSRFRKFIRRNNKYAPIIFFIGGFIFDSLTLGRIDRVYDLSILCAHMTFLSIVIYLYNRVDDGRWKNTLLEKYQIYLPLAIQFSFGGLSSAYVIYFSRSVSLSKTITFFVILVALLFANEMLKKRISNKYLQFSVYFFVSFTFFTFMIPVFIREMNTTIFLISGIISLFTTLSLIAFIYKKSPSTRAEIRIKKLLGIILTMYATINLFYFTNLIPPVPLALDSGMVAHNVQKHNGEYLVTYERDDWFVFWRDHRIKYIHQENENIYVFTSIFAPTEISKAIFHRWKWYNESTKQWEITDNIGYEITGGRDDGFRGYTFKSNVKPGFWKVDVVTEENLVLGIIDFEIIIDSTKEPKRMIERSF
ncbi:DUF2914 domain-containing protein [Brumimicrobium oceani]|uniref:DUF2914 domain-containing protein n=1 Tax=Brumimicrobium oceani TaxID=2100725 RepID=A0A2U2XFN6_9FLAO|nr:DUF2914 domain-containing protein [Brumimicrobium oceani]PWH86616.1 DUF2914 domain-containing protein [Brumimicrobium oceani]